jgi:type III pantothenate kinase
MVVFAPELIAVDIGNSRLKLGRFASADADAARLPVPTETVHLPVAYASGEFDTDSLAQWCNQHVGDPAQWLVASVHRGAAEKLAAAIRELSEEMGRRWVLRQLTYRDMPLEIRVDAPERVGIDRLLAAAAANRLRRSDRAAIVVEVGTAITVDLLQPDGAFAGGAILPGLTMSARALKEQTDALPHVMVETLQQPPEALGMNTAAAIESGLFWGAVGAIRELIERLSDEQESSPDVVISGGGSKLIADTLNCSGVGRVCHQKHLVLSGIAVVGSC